MRAPRSSMTSRKGGAGERRSRLDGAHRCSPQTTRSSGIPEEPYPASNVFRSDPRRDPDRPAIARARPGRGALPTTPLGADGRAGGAGSRRTRETLSTKPRAGCHRSHRGGHSEARRAPVGHVERQALPDVSTAQVAVLTRSGYAPMSAASFGWVGSMWMLGPMVELIASPTM